MKLDLPISKDRGTQDVDDAWRTCHILVWHCCFVTDVQFGVGLAGARGVTIIAGTLGWFGGADVQEILE